MARGLSEERKLQWKKKILEQRSSGLSIPSWCRQNGVAFQNFHYWQKTLFPNDSITHTSFVQIEDKRPKPAIILSYKEYSIHLTEHFDSSTLKPCLEVLKTC